MQSDKLLFYIVFFLFIVACNNGNDPNNSNKIKKCEHSARNGGKLVSIGNEYAHVEFILDRDKGVLTAIILDDVAQKEIVTDQKFIVLDISKQQIEPGQKVKLTFDLILRPIIMKKSDNNEGSSIYFVYDKRLIGVDEFDAVINNIIVDNKNYENIEFQFSSIKK